MSRDLIEQLDLIVPPAVVAGPTSDSDLRSLTFAAGRRDLVDQLKKVLNHGRT